MEFFSWKKQSKQLFRDGEGYLNTLEKHLTKPSRFDNTLLFNIAIMSYEKMFAALLAHYETDALHHTPVAMFNEASEYDKGLTDEMKEIAKFIQSFESICSFEDKPYRTPANEELVRIIHGLLLLKQHIAGVINQ